MAKVVIIFTITSKNAQKSNPRKDTRKSPTPNLHSAN